MGMAGMSMTFTKHCATLLGGLLLCPGVAAQTPDGPSTAALYACAATPDDAARLACFDTAVARLKAAEAGGDLAVVTREDVAEAQRKGFGLTETSPPQVAKLKTPKAGSPSLDEVTLKIVSVETPFGGKARFTAEDGQVWVQVDNEAVIARGRGPWTAEVRRGAIGSFFLKLDGGRAVRARRER
jgi:hypothetical protein